MSFEQGNEPEPKHEIPDDAWIRHKRPEDIQEGDIKVASSVPDDMFGLPVDIYRYDDNGVTGYYQVFCPEETN